MIIINIVLLIVVLVILLWQVSNLISVFYGSPYVKANRQVIIKALKLVNLKDGEIFYDLGCGNGDSLIEAEKMGAKAIGFEISPFYYLWAKLRISIRRIYYPFIRSSKQMGSGIGSIIVRYKNIYSINFSQADVVYCYLLPEMLKKLSQKFQKELKPGSRLISIGFPIKKLTFKTGVLKGAKYKVQNHWLYIYKF